MSAAINALNIFKWTIGVSVLPCGSHLLGADSARSGTIAHPRSVATLRFKILRKFLRDGKLHFSEVRRAAVVWRSAEPGLWQKSETFPFDNSWIFRLALMYILKNVKIDVHLGVPNQGNTARTEPGRCNSPTRNSMDLTMICFWFGDLSLFTNKATTQQA